MGKVGEVIGGGEKEESECLGRMGCHCTCGGREGFTEKVTFKQIPEGIQKASVKVGSVSGVWGEVSGDWCGREGKLAGVERSNLYLRDGRLPDGSGTGRSDFQVKRIMSSVTCHFPRL